MSEAIRSEHGARSGRTGAARGPLDTARVQVVAVLLMTAVALLLRLYGIDLRSLSHPEVYVPGIPLIEGHSVPPPRHTLPEVLWMHFHDEPHPMGWYIAMFGWTQLFGTSEFALRLPSAIIGAATVPLVFLLGKRVFGATAGLAAAAFLALHGFHLFWGQNARMYETGGFLSVLATLFLLRLVYDRDAGRLAGAGYVATLAALAYTVELFWPLVGVHIVWATVMLPADRAFRLGDLIRGRFAGAQRAVQLQAIALMFAVPELLHGVYRARAGAAEEPSFAWLREYLSFGFLFDTDYGPWGPPLTPGAAAGWALFAAALALLVLALRVPALPAMPAEQGRDVPLWPARLLALASTLFMTWLASIALARNASLHVVALGGLLSLAVPSLSVGADALIRRLGPLDRLRRRLNGPAVLIWLLAVASPLAIMAASHVMSLLADRAFLVFVPYLLLLITAPVALVSIRPALRAAGFAALMLLAAASVPYSWQKPGSPRDYKTLVAGMKPLMEKDDMVFVLDQRWEEAPLFYYLPDARYVFSDYAGALRADPAARVWLVTWPFEDVPVVNDERRAALAGYEAVRRVKALRASAELFAPPEGAAPD